MRRTLYSKLLEWKDSTNRKPLILEGARQVGKTWLLKEFGKNEYANVAYLNCHNNPDIKNLFSDFKIDRILRNISAVCDCTITSGNTLVIIDEIQESENGLAALKYFCEDAPDIHIAVAGSQLGLAYKRGESFPVGKVDILQLYPMSLIEFLYAMGKDALCDIILSCDWISQNMLKNSLEDILRQYYYVGGMPEAVKSYVEKGDIQEIRKIQNSILHAYEMDFSKHSPGEVQRIRLIWESIPAQLARENKKFIFGAVKKGARASYFDNALQWLKDAALIYRIERCKKIEIPLSFFADNDAFKIYLLDIGLLGALADIPAKQILLNNNIFSDFKGGFTENYVLQQLLNSCRTNRIFYFYKDNSSQEIDFILQANDEIVALEVKAEVNVKSKSLSQFVNVDNKEKTLKALRFSMLPYKDQGWMKNIPLWSVNAINKII